MDDHSEFAGAKPPPKPKPNPKGGGQGGSVNMEGWNTVNGLRFDAFNDAIVAQKATPPSFKKSNQFKGTISGKWDTWQVFTDGSSGGDLRMSCKIKSGLAKDPFGAQQKLDGLTCYITVRLAAVPTPRIKLTDPTGKPGTGQVKSLLIEKKGAPSEPPVILNTISNKAVFSSYRGLFQDWFTDNIDQFEGVFHSAILNVEAAKSKSGTFQWVKPKFYSYAVAGNTDKTALFGAMCQVDDGPYGQLAQQIPGGLVDDLPDTSNAVFAISGEKFTEHFLMAGAEKVIPGSKSTDFEIFGDGLHVRNVRPLDWIEMDYKGNKVRPKIPKHGLEMQVSQEQIKINFSGMTWDHKILLGMMGNDVFTLDFSQSVYLGLKFNHKQEPVFTTSNKPPGAPAKARELPKLDAPHLTVVPDKTAIKAQRIMQIVSMVGAVLGGAGGVIKVVRSVVNGFEVTEDATVAISRMMATGDSVFQMSLDAGQFEDGVADAEIDAGNAEGENAAAKPTPSVAATRVKYLQRFFMCSGLTAVGAGFGLSQWSSKIMKDDKSNAMDPDKLPTITGFIDNVVGTQHWPHLKTFTLQDAQLRESLLLYGKMSK